MKEVSNADREKCEGLLTLEECKKPLDSMHNGKSPGCDGITAEFYKVFWPGIRQTLVDTLNYSAIHGELSNWQ